MAWILLIIGAVMVTTGVKGTTPDLLSLLKGDLTGKNNFLYWIVSILAIGAVGYIAPLRPVSRAFLVLVIIVLVLTNGGFFQLFTEALNSTQTVSETPNINSSENTI